MPTPAVNLTRTVNATTTGSQPGKPDNTYLTAITVSRRVRPASVNHPRRADNTRPPGPWSGSWSTATPVTGLTTWQYARQTGNTASVRGMVVGDLPYAIPIPSAFTKYTNAARQKALAQATEKDMQLNAALAQANSTGRMVGNAASTFAHGLNSLMQGPKGLLKRFGRMANWKKTPDSYLEYLYGWRPLGDDVSNAFDKLNDLMSRKFGYSMIVHGAVSDREELTYIGSAKTHGGGNWSNSVIWGGNRKIVARAGYRFDLPQWFVEQTPTIAPYSTAWELTPYSFVADWVVPIGNWIGSMEAAQFAPHFKEGWEVIYVQDEWSIRQFNTTASPSTWWITSGSSKTSITNGCMSRTALTSYPWGSLPPPTLTKLPGIQQGAQGLALLTQAFKRWY